MTTIRIILVTALLMLVVGCVTKQQVLLFSPVVGPETIDIRFAAGVLARRGYVIDMIDRDGGVVRTGWRVADVWSDGEYFGYIRDMVQVALLPGEHVVSYFVQCRSGYGWGVCLEPFKGPGERSAREIAKFKGIRAWTEREREQLRQALHASGATPESAPPKGGSPEPTNAD